ncbi:MULTISPECIES: hypothetical protein [Bacteroides]|uniref:acyltransferase n=1 Tax=Bacteroides TaxID=816 RepID=UPI002A81AC34|nr:hypothetical protein [Bacteroides nordii]
MTKEKLLKIKRIFLDFRKYSLFNTIYFNFHYLPFKQAIFLPVWITYRNYCLFKGRLVIESDKIYPGMIKMGAMHLAYNRPRGMAFINSGGILKFKGSCFIGNDSIIDIGDNAILELGNRFGMTSSELKCRKSIKIGSNCSVGTLSRITDTDSHLFKNVKTGKVSKANQEIVIGNNNWFGYRTLVLKGTHSCDDVIVSGCSVVTKRTEFVNKCIVSGNPATIVGVGYYRDPFDEDPKDHED